MAKMKPKRELDELVQTVEQYTAFARSSIDKYDETGEPGHLSGTSNSLILIYEAIRQTLKLA